MMNNFNDMMNLYNQMRQNPMQMLSKRFNLPQDMADPNEIIQYLLNTGQVTQSQVNQATDQINGDGNSYVEKGTVYQDPETGKYYLVEDTSKNGSSNGGNVNGK